MKHNINKHNSFDNQGINSSSIRVDYDKLRTVTLMMRAVTHKLRQRIIEILQENPHTDNLELSIKLRLDVVTINQHLAILKRAKVLNVSKNGEVISYSVNESRLEKIREFYTELNQY